MVLMVLGHRAPLLRAGFHVLYK